MAQVMRFLALVHTVHGALASGSEDVVSLDSAVKFHDDAVSLLVGVFDDEEGRDGEEEQTSNINTSGNSADEGREDGNNHHQQQHLDERGVDAMSMDEFTEEGYSDDNDEVLLTIRIPASGNNKLFRHLKGNYNNSKTTPSPIQVTFLLPSEEQRVRAIAVSLNALAQMHAKCGDDRLAMDAYREALEILRAATEEGSLVESDDEYGISSSAGKKSHKHPTRPESDLAATLMNVGNFHLRRDELDAALNAYSTVFALHTGNSLDDVTVNSHVPASPLTPSSFDGRQAVESIARTRVALPHLSSPQTPRTPGTPHSQSTPFSAGALAALNNLGIVHERRGELEEALSCHDQVRLARIDHLGPDHFDVANAWVNVGNCLQRLQEWEKAGQAYEEAVVVYRKILQQKKSKKLNNIDSLDVCRVYRSFAGALRNWGTGYWKQRRISDALDRLKEAVSMEEKIISHQSIGDTTANGETIQAKESMSQMLGILGCLYVEYQMVELRSFKNSKNSFQRALQIYGEIGYDASHPSVLWVMSNLDSVHVMEIKSKAVPPPPPPPPTPPPSKKQSTETTAAEEDLNETIDLDQVLGEKAGEDEDSLFSGVEDFQDSNDELDEILSEQVNDGKVRSNSRASNPLQWNDPEDPDRDPSFDGTLSFSLR